MNVAPTNDESRATVLMYHRIGHAGTRRERRYCVSPERFASHMRALERRGMRPCAVDDFVAWIEGRYALREGSFVLTFDDGFLGVYEHAFPLLSQMRWPAVIFLVSGAIGKASIWMQQKNPTPRSYPLLGRTEILEMARGGFSFHSHSRSHYDLRALRDDKRSDELRGARRDLEDLLGRPVTYFAYPYGSHDADVVEAVKAAGYTAAFSVQPGFNRRDVDRYRIRRLDVYGTDSAAALLRKVTFGSNDGSLTWSLRYYADRLHAGLRTFAGAR